MNLLAEGEHAAFQFLIRNGLDLTQRVDAFVAPTEYPDAAAAMSNLIKTAIADGFHPSNPMSMLFLWSEVACGERMFLTEEEKRQMRSDHGD